MLSIYHFDTPLSDNCLITEQYLQKISQQIHRSHHLFFVPLINEPILKMIKDDNSSCADEPTDKASLVYRLTLDFKAAQIEGNKKARALLINLQEALTVGHQKYSRNLVINIAKKVGINITDFLYNRNSKETMQAILEDQQLAHGMMPKVQATIAIDDAVDLKTQILTDFSVNDLLPAFLPHISDDDASEKNAEASVDLA